MFKKLRGAGLSVIIVAVLISFYPDIAMAAQGVIKGVSANIRTGPGTDYNIHSTLLKDASVEVLDLNATPTNLRLGPGIDTPVAAKAKKGDILRLIDISGEWYQIQTQSGNTAYIHNELVSGYQSDNSAAPIQPTAVPMPESNNSLRILINGKVMKFEAEPIIENGRTLVPLRAIFEALGATVAWEQSTRTVTAQQGSNTVILPLDSANAIVNGNLVKLDVPARIINGRTLAPLRFTGEAFGSQVDWDTDTRTISINTSSRPGLTITVKESQINLREEPSVTARQVDVASCGERMPVITEKDGWYQVSRGGRNLWVASWVVDLEDMTSMPEPGNAVHLESIKDAAGLHIVIDSSEKLEPEIERESGHITILCRNHQVTGPSIIEEKLGSTYIRAKAANTKNDALINIMLPAEVEYKLLQEAAGCRYVMFIPNYIIGVEKVPLGSVGEQLVVKTLCPVNHLAEQVDNILEITLKNTKMGKAGSYSCNSDLIHNLQVSGSSDESVLLKINTANLGKYSIVSIDKKAELHIILIKNSVLNSGNRIVVLDPGHGGKEPGTRGQELTEKNVNLEVALKAGQILKQKGIQVEYSRTDDSFIDLEVRAQIANESNAALFVSVHHNGDTSPNTSGTETYFYAPPDMPELFRQKDERFRLAELVQSELRRLKLVNRGVKEDNFLVLKNTQIPSVLVEVAFLTNPSEEQLIRQEDFKDMTAQAIADGIYNFLQNELPNNISL